MSSKRKDKTPRASAESQQGSKSAEDHKPKKLTAKKQKFVKKTEKTKSKSKSKSKGQEGAKKSGKRSKPSGAIGSEIDDLFGDMIVKKKQRLIAEEKKQLEEEEREQKMKQQLEMLEKLGREANFATQDVKPGKFFVREWRHFLNAVVLHSFQSALIRMECQSIRWSSSK